MPMMTGGVAVVKSLVAEGVQVVFGVPGVQIMHIYNGFFDNPDIRIITCRHEQSAAYMADGYARSTGKLGVALVVPGPGAYNAGAALSTAYAASSPVMLLSGQIDSTAIGKDRGELHEVHDQLEFMKPVVKWNDRVSRAESIPEVIHEAVRQLGTGRPRPVEVQLPPDILATTADIDLIEPEGYPRPHPDTASASAAADLLASAQRPVLWVGGGVISANASRELVELAELLGAPVVTTPEGQGAIPGDHPLALGSSSFDWGAGGDIVPQADVILAVGTRLGRLEKDAPKESQKLINLNIDETEFGKTVPVAVGIAADAKVGLRYLINALSDRTRQSTWDPVALTATRDAARDRLRSAVPRQLALVEGIREAIPEDGFVVSGITHTGAWSNIAFRVQLPRTFITSSYMGTLGYGFPTALGVKVGNPDRPVVALCGDGGFMYAIGELATAAQHGINLVTVIFNNHGYGSSRRDQQTRFQGRVVGTDLKNPDFVKLAESFGVEGSKVEKLEDVSVAIKEAIAKDRPSVIEVETPADLDPPYQLKPPRR